MPLPRMPPLGRLAAARPPPASHSLRPPSVPQQRQQRRWAAVHDVRCLATTPNRRAIAEKYREKLDRKAREEGLPDVEALRAAYAEKIRELRRRDALATPELDGPGTASTHSARTHLTSPTSQPPRPSGVDKDQGTSTTATSATSKTKGSEPPPSVKPLSSILDLPKARHLPEKELSAVWRLRHASLPHSLCAVIPAPTYAAMEAAARRCPQFVLPVPHAGQGAEMHFLQWTFDDSGTRTSTVLFARLAEYQARGEFAVPHTTVTHYTDLAEEAAGVVLMRGEVVEGRGVKVEEAQWLAMCLQRFYSGLDAGGAGGQVAAFADQGALERAAERRQLLEWFAQGDERFSVERLLEAAERLG